MHCGIPQSCPELLPGGAAMLVEDFDALGNLVMTCRRQRRQKETGRKIRLLSLVTGFQNQDETCLKPCEAIFPVKEVQ